MIATDIPTKIAHSRSAEVSPQANGRGWANSLERQAGSDEMASFSSSGLSSRSLEFMNCDNSAKNAASWLNQFSDCLIEGRDGEVMVPKSPGDVTYIILLNA